MDVINVLIGLIGALANYGPVGKILAVVVGLAAGLSVVASALVATWHSLVALLTALSLLPYVGGAFGKLATFAKVSEPKFEGFVGKLIAVLQQLSSIPLPKKPADPAASK